MNFDVIVLTCEHAGNKIPPELADIFAPHTTLLSTHRGYDIGAFQLYKCLGTISDYCEYHDISRLVIDVNRSLSNRNLFSVFTRSLRCQTKQKIIESHYLPYRKSVEKKLDKFLADGKSVLHISIHTFTPVLNNTERNTDIGLLYDPQSKKEFSSARIIKHLLTENDHKIRVRFNYPYKGISDGFVTFLRKKYWGQGSYTGIEIELNQIYFIDEYVRRQALMQNITEVFEKIKRG